MQKQGERRDCSGRAWMEAGGQLLKGSAAAVGAVLVLALLCAAGIVAGLLEEDWLEGLVLACCFLGALAGGSIAVRAIGRRNLPVGLAVGGVLFLLLLTVGGLRSGTLSPGETGLPILTACLGGGAGAGILVRPPKKKRRR